MKVFISWSGARSKELAIALRDWLPLVLNYVDPWVSDKDIKAGDRWAQSIAGELENSNFGIICVTPENVQSEWILFEAGALSKSMLDGKVIPLLFGLELSDLGGPLSQFQAQKVEREGILEVVRSINLVADNSVDEDIVQRVVPPLWPVLEKVLDDIPTSANGDKSIRTQREVLEELVSGVRGISSRIIEISNSAPSPDEVGEGRHRRSIGPKDMHYLSRASDEIGESDLILLMIAGELKEEVPWLAEVFLETYRDVNSRSRERIEASLNRLRKLLNLIRHGELGYLMRSRSKYRMRILEETSFIIEVALSQIEAALEKDKSGFVTSS